ncbi:MAG: O-antigen ligase family protein [Pseudomonadota bacterium]
MRIVILVIIFAVFVPLAGFVTVEYNPSTLLLGAVGVAIFFVSFVNIEIGLYILILSMLLSPEFLAGQTTGSSLSRGVTLRYEDFLLVIIGGSWFAKNAVFKEIGLFRKTDLNLPIVLYMLACIFSTGLGIMMGNVMPKTGFFYVLKYVEYFIVYFVIVNHVEDQNQIKRFIFFLFLTCFIVSVVGIMQIPGGERVSAPFEGEVGEPNTFGGYLVLSLSVIAGIVVYGENKFLKKILILLTVFIIPPLLYTQSRSSYLAAFVVALCFAMFSRKRILYISAMILMVIFSPFIMPKAVKERVLFTVAQKHETGQIQIGDVRIDTSTSARLLSWKNAVKDWTNHPIFGYGITGYAFMDAQFPRVLVETGIVGLFAFLYLLFAIGKMALKNLKELNDPFSKGIAYGFFAGFIGLLVHSIGANTFIIVRIMEPFWFYAGIVAVLPELEKEQEIMKTQVA